MKKIISILLVFVMLNTLCFAGCNGKDENLDNKDNTAIYTYNMTKVEDEFTLTVDSQKDFVILNLTDTQLDYDSWIKKDS